MFLVGFLSCCIQGIFAEDLESGVRDYVKNGDWSNFKIANSTFGNVEATRAATEDKRTNSSLALTYPTQSVSLLQLSLYTNLTDLRKKIVKVQFMETFRLIPVTLNVLKQILLKKKVLNFFIVVHENKLDDALKMEKF
ncbi:hypothetical protein IDM30_09960 [Acinetobacter seifertii]|nr:hypothetical protein [Acinetobacter seifertii]